MSKPQRWEMSPRVDGEWMLYSNYERAMREAKRLLKTIASDIHLEEGEYGYQYKCAAQDLLARIP